MKESSQRSGLAVEAIEGIETLKTNNATSWAQQRWDEYTAKTSAASIKVKDTSNFMINFTIGMQQLNTVGLSVLGTYLIHAENPAERITIGCADCRRDFIRPRAFTFVADCRFGHALPTGEVGARRGEQYCSAAD